MRNSELSAKISKNPVLGASALGIWLFGPFFFTNRANTLLRVDWDVGRTENTHPIGQKIRKTLQNWCFSDGSSGGPLQSNFDFWHDFFSKSSLESLNSKL